MADKVPSGTYSDNSYVTQRGEPLQVQSDDARVEDPIDDTKADTDAQLDRDEAEAIDKSNIVGGRTRDAKPRGTYREPGDTEGIPEDTGRSNMSSTSGVLRNQ